ncbi:endophilin-B1-like [Daphnia pulicaria]|uniref:endophilin-B1-like n=1 Tax=Daphnia pulicaria TaxID=35523 RepID=UPI001EEA78CD|nr:endophilin-B1-like [Daphnia pulicaria]
MEFNVKKLVGDAGTLFTRAVQFTEEKLGTSEKTELDAHFENLSQRCDLTKSWTEKLVRDVDSVLTPNPGNRVEDFLMDKIERRRLARLSNLDYLGVDMVEAGNDLGPGTLYGSTLLKVGLCQQKLGALERDFATSATQAFVDPLKKFMESDLKSILRERKLLESKRLDLDAAKNRLRKSKTQSSQQMAEQEVNLAQIEFDRQSEVTRLLLEGIGPAHTSHCKHLQDFAAAQARYFLACSATLQQLQKELGALSLQVSTSDITFNNPSTPGLSERRKARVICDYDSQDITELSLIAGEVIDVVSTIPNDPDYVQAERGHQAGKIPSSYLEFIDQSHSS